MGFINKTAKFFLIFLIVFAFSCTNSEPVISFGFIQLVLYQGEPSPREYFSFFILAEDEDGYENLDELFIFHDREQLRWHLKSDEWLHYTFDEKNWIGTKSMTVPSGILPNGVYRVVLFNKGGESTQRSFTYDGNVNFPFPAVEISGGVYTVSSQWPVNRFICYDSSGNYVRTILLDSLTGEMSQLRLPSSVRTVALWAEDEDNFCSAFTNVVPVN